MLNDSENTEYEEFAEEVQEAPAAKRPRIRMDVVHPPGTFNIQLRNKSSLNKVDGSKEQFLNHDETVGLIQYLITSLVNERFLLNYLILLIIE